MPANFQFITFVLGAGSSFEVDMPTGSELKSNIAASLSFKVDHFRQLEGGDGQIREAIYALGQRPETGGYVNDYYQAAIRIKDGMLQAPSIDNFIDSNRSNKHIAEVGKLAIASAILKAERSSKLYVKPTNINNKPNFSGVSDTWFNAFFHLLCLNAQEEDLPARLARVKVITFNYDRTLEHFLFYSIQNYYGSSPERAAEILSNLTILHPYGQVGSLPWQNIGFTVPFGGEFHLTELLEVSKTLRTFTEGTSDKESEIEKIRSSIYDCEILSFLGFAYHELNLELLFGPQRAISAKNSKKIYGTARGLSESNKKDIASELSNFCNLSLELVTLRRELSAAELLPEYSRALRIPNAA